MKCMLEHFPTITTQKAPTFACIWQFSPHRACPVLGEVNTRQAGEAAYRFLSEPEEQPDTEILPEPQLLPSPLTTTRVTVLKENTAVTVVVHAFKNCHILQVHSTVLRRPPSAIYTTRRPDLLQQTPTITAGSRPPLLA